MAPSHKRLGPPATSQEQSSQFGLMGIAEGLVFRHYHLLLLMGIAGGAGLLGIYMLVCGFFQPGEVPACSPVQQQHNYKPMHTRLHSLFSQHTALLTNSLGHGHAFAVGVRPKPFAFPLCVVCMPDHATSQLV
eukprot:scaffold225857_cov23-Tisochrysis_lutea.AAC.1